MEIWQVLLAAYGWGYLCISIMLHTNDEIFNPLELLFYPLIPFVWILGKLLRNWA